MKPTSLSKLKVTYPATGKSFVMDGEKLFRKNETDYQQWIQNHYGCKVECLCQKTPIPMVLDSTTGSKTGKVTYSIRTHNSKKHPHHPDCLFKNVVHHVPIQSIECIQNGKKVNKWLVSVEGIKYPVSRPSTTSTSKTSSTQRSSERVKNEGLQRFSLEWNATLMRRKNFQVMNKEERPYFPDWRTLFSLSDYDLEEFVLDASGTISFKDLFIAYPSKKAMAKTISTFKTTHQVKQMNVCLLTQGRVRGYQGPDELKTEGWGLLKLSVKEKGRFQTVYLWILDVEFQRLLKRQSFSVDFSDKDVVWWLTAFLPPELPKRLAPIGTSKIPVPEIKEAALMPLALNGWWVENEAELQCFNRAKEEKLLIHRPSSSDLRSPFKGEETSTFLWIHPQATKTTSPSVKYQMGQIFYSYASDYLLNQLKKEKMPLWVWDATQVKTCPELPLFEPLDFNPKRP